MKHFFTSMLLVAFASAFAQKKTNGVIYIEHPAIETVSQFNEAYVTGDLEKLKELMTDDVKVYTLSDRESNDAGWIIGTSNWLSKNIADFNIKHYGGSYPDVLEYDKDGAVDVKTYEWMTGYDRNTGVTLNMPRYATYRMDSKGKKISMIFINDDQSLWEKNWDAYDTNENGVIYKDHPYVSKVRLLYKAYESGILDSIKSHYTPKTRFYDVMNSEINEYKSLEEEFAQFNDFMSNYEVMRIKESGFPDVLDYKGDGAVVISWSEWTIKNKKSGESKTIMLHWHTSFNEDGEIVREDYYFNPAMLPK